MILFTEIYIEYFLPHNSMTTHTTGMQITTLPYTNEKNCSLKLHMTYNLQTRKIMAETERHMGSFTTLRMFLKSGYSPSVERTPHPIHTTRHMPTDPVRSSTPLGDTKIPDPAGTYTHGHSVLRDTDIVDPAETHTQGHSVLRDTDIVDTTETYIQGHSALRDSDIVDTTETYTQGHSVLREYRHRESCRSYTGTRYFRRRRGVSITSGVLILGNGQPF